MVQIPTYEARVGLDAPSYPTPRLDNSIGEALQSAGSAMAAMGNRMKDRQKQKDSFNAAIGFDRLHEDMQQSLADEQRNAAADGTGLHDTFVQKHLTPKTDAFLASIDDPELKAQYSQRLGLLRDQWSNRAANGEYDLGNKHSLSAIGSAWDNRSRGIAQNPAAADAYVTEMGKLIDDAPNLTSAQRQDLKTKITDSAPGIVAEALKQQDPETFYFASGNGTHDERVAFLTKRLVPAVKVAENAPGDPRAVSKDGAIGIMQVTVGAADTVAGKAKDKAFLALSPEQKAEALKDPATNEKFGTSYLNMLVEQYRGDAEAALIAYNAGPGNADKWLKAGRDYAALPRRGETEPYVQKVLGNLGTAQLASGASSSAASGARIAIETGTQPGRQPLNMSGLDKGVVDLWERTQGAFGKAVPVVSAYRDAAANAAAGGAKHSAHMGGKAIDIDVSQLSKAERVRLIEVASAQGFTGIGVYNNSLHFDTGHRRAWGPSHGGASVPSWAAAAIGQHLAGKTATVQPPAGGQVTATEGSPVPYAGAQRSGFVSAAFAAMPSAALLETQGAAADLRVKATDQIRQAKALAETDSQNLVDADIASLSQSGKGTVLLEQFDATSAKVFQTLGPEKHSAWLADRFVAQRTHDLTSDAYSLSPQAMTSRLEQLKPQGGANAVADQKVFDAVSKKFEEVGKLRSEDPGLAVQQMAGVKDAAASVDWSQPQSAQDYLAQVEAAQAMLQLPDRALLPKAHAAQLGSQFRNVLRANPGFETEATQAFLDKLQGTYGNYADDIFTQAYETVLDKDISKPVRDMMSSLVLDWAQGKPGMLDDRYAMARELAATDMQPDMVNPTPTERTWFEYMTGAPKPEPVKAAKPLPPRAPVAPITVDGVPADAVDTFIKNPGNMKIQHMFRQFYGADRLKDMQDQLRKRGLIAAAN